MASWTTAEVHNLETLYPNTEIDIDEICEILKRSKDSIHLKANKLSLKRDLLSTMQNPRVREKISRSAKKRVGVLNPFYGKKHQLSTIENMKRKLSIRFSGSNNPFWGKHHTSETRLRLRLAKRQSNLTGENNPAWRGGYEPYYGPNWAEQRRKVLARDNYRCTQCGRTEEENGKELDVHHIIPFRKFGIERYTEANREENLLTLCVHHHRKELGGGD